MERVYKWIDEHSTHLHTAHMFRLGLNANDKQHSDDIVTIKVTFKDMIHIVEAELLKRDAQTRGVLFRQLFRRCDTFFDFCNDMAKREYPMAVELGMFIIPKGSALDISAECLQTFTNLLGFYSELARLCTDYDLTVSDYCEDNNIKILEEFAGSVPSHTTPIKPQRQTPLTTKWQDYIIGAHKEAWERLITEELNNAGKHSGRLFAMIICAMRREGAIKEIRSKTKFYTLLRDDFPLLATDSGINKYLNTDSPNSYDRPITNDEIEAIIKKVSCY